MERTWTVVYNFTTYKAVPVEVFGSIPPPLSTVRKPCLPARAHQFLIARPESRWAHPRSLGTEKQTGSDQRQIEQTTKQLYMNFMESDIAFGIAIAHATGHLVTIDNANVITLLRKYRTMTFGDTYVRQASKVVKGTANK